MKKNLADTRLDLRHAAKNLQIERKGGASWGPIPSGRNTEHETRYSNTCIHISMISGKKAKSCFVQSQVSAVHGLKKFAGETSNHVPMLSRQTLGNFMVHGSCRDISICHTLSVNHEDVVGYNRNMANNMEIFAFPISFHYICSFSEGVQSS